MQRTSLGEVHEFAIIAEAKLLNFCTPNVVRGDHMLN